MNTFEAYNSIKKRQRAAVSAGEQNTTTNYEDYPVLCMPIKTERDDRKNNDIENEKESKIRKKERTGRLLELFEVQLVVVCCIFLDIITSIVEILLTYNINRNSHDDISDYKFAILRVVESLSGFVLFFFLLEIITLLVIFREKFFVHMGYLLDLGIIGVCLVAEVKGVGKEVRMLNFFRVWRLIRLVNSMLGEAKAEHNDTLGVLRLEQTKYKELQVERVLLQDSLQREAEARKSVEQMLKGYKDEVETLSEALKIAALDVAESARDEFLEEEEEEGYLDEEGEEFFDEGMEGAPEQETFVVRGDGSFIKTGGE
ncbi:hypothetical protein ScalyP_jg8171 [Parmales sp. scaly parma]|nr:hypothetical protein ScalyP_jg8171 [Parmales sp. scaly parma]